MELSVQHISTLMFISLIFTIFLLGNWLRNDISKDKNKTNDSDTKDTDITNVL